MEPLEVTRLAVRYLAPLERVDVARAFRLHAEVVAALLSVDAEPLDEMRRALRLVRVARLALSCGVA